MLRFVCDDVMQGEKQRLDMQREINVLKEKLEDAQDALHKQVIE